MKKRLSGGLHTGRGILAVFMTVLLMFCAGSPVHGATVDLLHLPSEKFDRASSYILTDVVNVNGRMVAVGEWGRILYTEDEKCEAWFQADVPVSVTLTSVYFPTDEKGWAVGHDGIVLHTKDGGKTWEKQLDGVTINKLMLEQAISLSKTETNILENEKVLAKSIRQLLEDGTHTDEFFNSAVEDWSFFLSDIKMAVGEGPIWPLLDVWFKNDQEGVVIGSFGMILGTTDGGKTWEPRLDSIENLDGFHYYGITRSGNDLFIAGESGMLFRSEDYGRTWQRLESPYDGSYFGITGDPNGGFVIAFGLQGNVSYSFDRGNTWIQSNTGNTVSLMGGAFLSDGSFCLLAVDGTILQSRDRGKTFAPLKKKFPAGISLTEVKKGTVAVVGMLGVTTIDLIK